MSDNLVLEHRRAGRPDEQAVERLSGPPDRVRGGAEVVGTCLALVEAS